MSFLEVSNISRLEDGNFIVKDISFSQQQLQKIAIAGAAGSGKTTLLKIIAGLIKPTLGTILFDDKRVENPEEKLIAGHPAIAYLSQHFELRNHYRVEEIVAMANRLTTEEAETTYGLCHINHLMKKWTHQLSGGEKQRIALARLLISSPRLLLLDEPYSNLDAIHKNMLKSVIHDIGEALQITCILVSHDPLDAISWADEIIVLKDGQLIQQSIPEQVYLQPVNEYVAALFGKYTVLNPALFKAFSAFAGIEKKDINRFIRPENFKLVTKANGVKGKVKSVSFLGSYCEVEIEMSAGKIIMNSYQYKIAKNDTVYIAIKLPE